MTRLATILLLAAASNAQFAGDAAAGGTATKPKQPKQTNWMGLGQATKPAATNATKPKRKRWKRIRHIPPTDPRSPYYVDPNAPKTPPPTGRARNKNGCGARGSRGSRGLARRGDGGPRDSCDGGCACPIQDAGRARGGGLTC